MLRNMVTSLLTHEQITTTVPKAKEARRLAEKVITLGKKGGLHNVRLARRTVTNRDVLQKVFGELKERYAKRNGGYTRLLRAGFRRGDAADVAVLELIDRPAAAAPSTEAKGETEAKAETAEPKKKATKKKAEKAE